MKVSNPPIEEQYPTKDENPLLILITGGAASGKTTFTQQLREYLEQNQQKALILPFDNYYAYSPLLFQSRNPILHEIFLWEELNKDLEALLAGKSIYLPIYENSRERKFARSITFINSSPIIIIEGMLSFFNKEIREKSPLKIYLEVSEKTRLERRLARYKKGLEEGKFTKPVEYEIERFYKGKPKENQETYVEPVETYADLVINYDIYERKVEIVIGEIREKLK
ncbi:P-loop containing nucleoside triphosphate hydrolase protein [Rhizophagus irregularis]|uniref:P-loop containing nucleoside triphosphate hydrolase protein n=1 Tax=Rhizophagus irregularis TaxID=588596 RepID=A0A2N0RC64_9GLOM|nr:P-loop containing nucleoside triphosphate hydrolase protein [Rhizophagus irregularis]